MKIRIYAEYSRAFVTFPIIYGIETMREWAEVNWENVSILRNPVFNDNNSAAVKMCIKMFKHFMYQDNVCLIALNIKEI